MSAHINRKAKRKYMQRISSERAPNQRSHEYLLYLHPNASVEFCLYRSLMQYLESVKKIFLNFLPDTETPIVLTGDFNIDVRRNQSLVEFMQREFRLQYVPTTPTTLGNTTIDLTFVRNINISVMPFVSYFSYHRPMLNKIVIDYQLRLCIFVVLNKSHVSISLLSFHSHIPKKISPANADVFT
ncbi:hypothetical protein L798_13243 [Zootermopsis nevadensis]|uniref:Endonuclease/exonuclease/phosphatase domain-containing protein n=1 Tax=Zootermopsis nevadensis TaxID=136037 RepID=A0A067R4C2_ZOONE|nr:hypothetical protein L798_13243 [Zootermopsis nevadensis]